MAESEQEQGVAMLVWRGAVVLLITILGSLTAWGLNSVTELKTNCVRTIELRCVQERMDTQFDRLSDKIDDINKYLRKN